MNNPAMHFFKNTDGTPSRPGEYDDLSLEAADNISRNSMLILLNDCSSCVVAIAAKGLVIIVAYLVGKGFVIQPRFGQCDDVITAVRGGKAIFVHVRIYATDVLVVDEKSG